MWFKSSQANDFRSEGKKKTSNRMQLFVELDWEMQL